MAWDRKKITEMPASGSFILAGDDRIETYNEDMMMRGHPDAVLIARDEKDVSSALAYCYANDIPVTFCGSRTSMTGASVPYEGLLISTENMEGVVDIYNDGDDVVADIRPGTITAKVQEAVEQAGYFYPVAPTSRDECRIGSNLATNAMGEDSYKYGPVRPYVKKIELMSPDGRSKILTRERNERPSWERNRAGYFVNWKNPIDLIIASEGTLGFVSKITLKLLPKSPKFFSAFVPFKSDFDALNFVAETASSQNNLRPRALEFIGQRALGIMKTAIGFPSISEDIGAFLYIKQEYSDDADEEKWMMSWYDRVAAIVGEKLAGQILVADTHKQQEDFRLWRHRIPESESESGRELWKEGGGKIGSDWWVPIPKLIEMMKFFYDEAEALGLPYIAYAHIGAGHPHTNFMAGNPKDKERAHQALLRCCKKAAQLGGGVAGEHGIGKIHTDLIPIQYSGDVINKMREWKKEYDPKWLLGRGNILDV